VELFYRHGFAAVGIDRVIATAGVAKSTFYKHFESKDDLMVAAVVRRDEWESQAWGRAVRKLAGDDPAAQLLAMLDVMDVWFNDPDFRGCLFTNTAMEFPNPHDPVHQAAAAYKRRARDHWRDLARAAGADTTAAETFADCYTALIEGALVLRLTKDGTTQRERCGPRFSSSFAHICRGSNLEGRGSNSLRLHVQPPRQQAARVAGAGVFDSQPPGPGRQAARE
jgi:AcrR family transcriptional regulator